MRNLEQQMNAYFMSVTSLNQFSLIFCTRPVVHLQIYSTKKKQQALNEARELEGWGRNKQPQASTNNPNTIFEEMLETNTFSKAMKMQDKVIKGSSKEASNIPQQSASL
jgi:hypothetical protein